MGMYFKWDKVGPITLSYRVVVQLRSVFIFAIFNLLTFSSS